MNGTLLGVELYAGVVMMMEIGDDVDRLIFFRFISARRSIVSKYVQVF
jgi:hypothetical protein